MCNRHDNLDIWDSSIKTDELKPCSCGDSRLIVLRQRGGQGDLYFKAGCKSCKLSTKNYQSAAFARYDWNHDYTVI